MRILPNMEFAGSLKCSRGADDDENLKFGNVLEILRLFTSAHV